VVRDDHHRRARERIAGEHLGREGHGGERRSEDDRPRIVDLVVDPAHERTPGDRAASERIA
jgi:hypothetical protein